VAPSVQPRKVWLTPATTVPCSAKTRNPLKLAGVPQSTRPISVASGPKFTTLWGYVDEILLFNNVSIVDMCLNCEDIARLICAMVPRWRFFTSFCVLHFQRAACSTFQTCILNSHEGHTMCGSTAGIQSAAAEIRRGKKKKIVEEEEETTRQKYNGLPYYIGRPYKGKMAAARCQDKSGGRCTQSDSAGDRTGTVPMPMGSILMPPGEYD